MTGVMETDLRGSAVNKVDITDVENSVENVEKPSVSGKTAVENPVDKVDKKLHRG